MKVDHALILAAGKGTRMGEIGKRLPKVLWPVFEKSILELEVDYCHEFFTENVYVNLYNYKEKILEKMSSLKSKNFTFVEEKEELDIGGAVHNLAKKLDYKGKLLVINSDQFIMLPEKLRKEFITSTNKFDSTILTYTVNKNEKYNKIDTHEGKVINLIQNNECKEDSFETYTGMSIINLESLAPAVGKSKFFDSVANFKKLNIGAINISESTYWDFGTLERYYNSMFNVLDENMKSSPDAFISFLKKYKALNVDKINEQSYFSKTEQSISLKGDYAKKGNIILGHHNLKLVDKKCIVFEDIIESLDV